MRHVAVLLGLLLGLAPASAREAAEKPDLIVVISVDQFSANLFAEYRQHFTGGLRRLSTGAVFPAGFQSHAATETCPGHSTILTGSRPARTGIIANEWYDARAPREDKYVYCAEDERVAGSNSDDYTVSPVHLRVKALGDWMKAANRRSRVVSVAGKDRSAVMMAGHKADHVYWWDQDKTGFVTYGAVRPDEDIEELVAGANAGIAATIKAAHPAHEVTDFCRAHAAPVPLEGGGKPVGDARFAREAGDARGFRGSPEFDQATLDLASAFRRELELGEGRATDLLIVGLAATDYVGHLYGPGGGEMCLQLLALDRMLGAFYAELNAAGIDYVVVLTADLGGLDIPERARRQGISDARRIDGSYSTDAINQELAKRLSLPAPIIVFGGIGDIYLSPDLKGADRARALTVAMGFYRESPVVEAVFSRAEIRATPIPSGPPDSWTLIERARASFDERRSGDFVVLLKPNVTPIADTTRYSSTHGSPWDYDRGVPILFWRAGMTPFEQPLAVETIDILPTLAALIGLRIPQKEIDGHCLDLDSGEGDTCKLD